MHFKGLHDPCRRCNTGTLDMVQVGQCDLVLWKQTEIVFGNIVMKF